jgi:hypothetical protein
MSLGAESMSRPLRRAVAYAHRKGVVLVAAIGNEFHYHHNFPATFDQVIAVGGVSPDTATITDRDERLPPVATNFAVRPSYSDYGPHLDVVAPTQVPTADYGGDRYNLKWSGTSASTPHVAATAALVLARGRQLGIGLTPGEVRQIVRQTATDLTGSVNSAGPGWDRFTGWGRVNAYEAVRRVAPGRIPPDPDIVAPEWYSSWNAALAVRGRVRGRSATRWELELGGGEEPSDWRTIATGRARGRRLLRLSRIDTGALARGGYTLRLRATDANGNVGEDRAYFFALGEPSLKRRYPKRLFTSGESSPQLADLTGDGFPEIVLATSDGALRVYSGRNGRMVRGWPRRMRNAFGSRATRRRIGAVRSGFVATPAIGNVAGSRRPEVVAAGLDGRVYAWNRRGRRLRGFPVAIDARRPAPNGRQDYAIYASPALADLSGDGKLDIVVGAADQKLYAWSGRGRRLPGWPVLARDGDDFAKILSSPAVGDLNGDGSPEVVEATAEVYGSTPSTSGRVYAFTARGERVPGWPVKPGALAADAIPLAGEGVPDSPALADVDGDGADEVAIAAFTGAPELYRGDGSRMTGASGQAHFETTGTGSDSRSTAPAALALGGNGAFGRLSAGGPLRFFSGLVDERIGAAQTAPAQRISFEHLLGGWDARSGSWLAGFPAPVEGWVPVTAPAIADVDGDGGAEAIFGTSSYLLHAFREDGTEAPGWPKQTGGWLIAGPAVGDVDRDRRLEVVAVTREGNLFVWDTPAPADGLVEWPSFRHDARNSGRYP